MTAIEWTDTTWNPTTGCDRVSPGCDHCYALTMARRLKGMGSEKYQRDGDPRTSGPGFGITEHPSVLDAPLRWRKPRRVFVNSMSDLFHQGVSDEFIARVWAVMALTPQHTYQVLTKRHGRMRSLLGAGDWPTRVREALDWASVNLDPALYAHRYGAALKWTYTGTEPLSNVWLGVSVEDQKRADLRIPALLDTPAAIRFLSCEPLLGPVDLVQGPGTPAYLTAAPAVDRVWCPTARRQITTVGDVRCTCTTGHQLGQRIDWVIAGGESGAGARPMHPDWARTLRDQCTQAHVAFHLKQLGAWTETPQPGRPDVLLDRDGHGRPWAHRNRDGVVHLWHAKSKYDTGRELDGRVHDEFPSGAS